MREYYPHLFLGKQNDKGWEFSYGPFDWLKLLVLISNNWKSNQLKDKNIGKSKFSIASYQISHLILQTKHIHMYLYFYS